MSIEMSLARFGKLLDKCITQFSKFVKKSKATKIERQNNDIKLSSKSILTIDIVISSFSIFLSIFLRIGCDFIDYSAWSLIETILVYVLISAGIFLWFGTHLTYVEYVTSYEIFPVIMVNAISNIIFCPLMLLMNQDDFLPYTVVVINTFVATTFMLVFRFYQKNKNILKMRTNNGLILKDQKNYKDPVQTLIFGDTESLSSFIEDQIKTNYKKNIHIIGALTEEQEDFGRIINGVQILGELCDISYVIKELEKMKLYPKELIITKNNIEEKPKAFIERCANESLIKVVNYV